MSGDTFESGLVFVTKFTAYSTTLSATGILRITCWYAIISYEDNEEFKVIFSSLVVFLATITSSSKEG